MSKSPPFGHLDFSPVAAVAGVVLVASVAASSLLGADGPTETAAAVAVLAAPVAGAAVWLVRRS